MLRIQLTIIFCCISTTAFSGNGDVPDLFDDETISISTGHNTPQRQAPAVSTVITRHDIELLGLRTLDEALQLVPGMHVSRHADGNPLYLIRGIYSSFNPHVLFLVNGTAITNSYHGNRGQVWAGMSTHNIRKIEVIRGPGSALHGADAYAGIVNIITEQKPQSSANDFGVRVGSKNTQQTWFNHKTVTEKLKFTSSFNFYHTDGHKPVVQSDAQSFFDGINATNASLAPGSVNNEQKWFDIHASLYSNNWQASIWHQGRRDIGTNAGIAQALDPNGHKNGDRTNIDLIWQNEGKWNWQVKNSLSHFSNRSDLTIFPPGTDLGGGAFPEGMIGNPHVYEFHYKGQVSANYTQIKRHRFAFGLGFQHNDIYRTEETKNFNPDFSPIGSIIDVSDTDLIFLKEKYQQVSYLFVQDEWSLGKDISLTTGVRSDHYTDFGFTTNPRIALVWNARFNTSLKFLYGRAFRAPSFSEQYLINNPVAVGNEDLTPETIDTVEVFFQHQPLSSIVITGDAYYYEMEKVIEYVGSPNTAQNNASKRGRGLEMNVKYRHKNLQILSHYSYQEVEDISTNTPLGHAPGQKWFLAAIASKGNWNLAGKFNWIINRERSGTDSRTQDPEDYQITDLFLRYQIKRTNASISLKLNNVFDTQASEPSAAPGRIVYDLPLEGRSLFLEMELTR